MAAGRLCKRGRSRVYESSDDAGAHSLRVVILDACRNNPFEATMKRIAGAGRNIGLGLARVEPAQGTVIVFSAKAGTIAADGDGG